MAGGAVADFYFRLRFCLQAVCPDTGHLDTLLYKGVSVSVRVRCRRTKMGCPGFVRVVRVSDEPHAIPIFSNEF
jgi:hypothetical protein